MALTKIRFEAHVESLDEAVDVAGKFVPMAARAMLHFPLAEQGVGSLALDIGAALKPLAEALKSSGSRDGMQVVEGVEIEMTQDSSGEWMVSIVAEPGEPEPEGR